VDFAEIGGGESLTDDLVEVYLKKYTVIMSFGLLFCKVLKDFNALDCFGNNFSDSFLRNAEKDQRKLKF
jgi:hypothetical protein